MRKDITPPKVDGDQEIDQFSKYDNKVSKKLSGMTDWSECYKSGMSDLHKQVREMKLITKADVINFNIM